MTAFGNVALSVLGFVLGFCAVAGVMIAVLASQPVIHHQVPFFSPHSVPA